MSKTDYLRIITGEPIKTIVRVKPPTNYLKEDIKLIGSNISIIDANNRLIEEFDAKDAYGPEFTLQQIFDNSLTPFLSPFIQGFSISVLAFGSTGSGKTQVIEGSKKEPGLILLFADSLFNLLENKKYHTNSARNSQAQNYSFGIRVRYVEIVDEEVVDLLALSNKFGDPLQVLNHEWEGPTITNCNWITVSDARQLMEVFQNGKKNRNNNSNEYGKLSSKATSIFTLELIQTVELIESQENLVLISKLNFFDLPGSEILLEDPEAVRVRQGNTLNKSILALSAIIKDLASTRNDYVYYEASLVTHLMRDTLGGNALTVALFIIQNGDVKGTSLALNTMKYMRKITNFPVVNDGKALGLLRKMRTEVIVARNARGGGMGDGAGGDYNFKIVDLEKKLIADNLDKIRFADEKQRLAQKYSDLREKYNQLVKSKSDLQAELIKSEEEKLEVSKALVDLQIENTKLMEIVQNEKYDMNNKLLNAEGDVLALNMKEEKALKQIAELQDRLKELAEEKREIEIEFVALKKNFISASTELEGEKKKNENLGVELINLVNENKALHDEINDIYKKSGSTNDENAKFINKIERLEKENQEMREALIFSKAEIERLKTEKIKFEVIEQQHRLDLDSKKIDLERSMIEINKEKQDEISKVNRDTENLVKKNKDEKMYWESQKVELSHKNKLYQRKNQELEERINELIQMNEELHTDNTKMSIQLDEMRSVYRGRLLQFMNEQMAGGGKAGDNLKFGYDMNAREEIIRTYNEKEVDLNERIEKERTGLKNLKMELRGLKNYARNLRYLAEDWAPVGVPLPDILTKPPPVKFDEDNIPANYQRNNSEEVENLRRRNRRLEEEVKLLQDQVVVQTNNWMKDEKDVQKRLITEIEFLKGKPEILRRPGSSDLNIENMRKERNELQEENRRLIGMLKDNKKWDIYILQRENEKLIRQVKEFEGESVGPISGGGGGGDKHLKQKLAYYEKVLRQLEKERSELIVRATMAEEQLKNMQEHLNKTTQEYQRKLMEYKKMGK